MSKNLKKLNRNTLLFALVLAFSFVPFFTNVNNVSAATNTKVRSYATYGFIAVIILNFLYFFPLFTGGIISYDHWSSMMWLPSWI